MASPEEIQAGGATIRVTGDNDPVKAALNDTKSYIQSWGKDVLKVGSVFAGMGATISSPFAYGLTVFADWGKEVQTAMRQTGIDFENLDLIMDGMKVSADELVPAVAKMSSFLEEADSGSGKAAETIAKLGLSIEQLKAMSQGERVLAFADALSNVADAGERIAMQREVFGRGGLALNIQGGRAGIQARAARADFVEGVQTNEMFEAARDYNRAMSEAKQATSGFWLMLGSIAAPVFADVARGTMSAIITARQFVEQNKDIFEVVLKVGLAVGALGSAILFLGALVYGLSFPVAGLTILWGFLTGVFGGFVSFASTGFGVLTAFSWAWSTAAVLASLAATAALLPYKVALATATLIYNAWNITVGVSTFLYGILTAALALVQTATWGYIAGLIVAWIWENIASVGLTLLITLFGVFVIAIGAVIFALGGFLIVAGLMVAIPFIVMALVDAFSDLFDEIGDSQWFSDLTDMFGKVAETGATAWAALKAAFQAGDFSLIWDIIKVSAELMWMHISSYFVTTFYTIKDSLLDIFDDVWMNIKAGFINMWGEMKFNALRGLAEILAASAALDPTGASAEHIQEQVNRLAAAADAARNNAQASIQAMNREAEELHNAERAARAARDEAMQRDDQERVRQLNNELEDLRMYAEFLAGTVASGTGAGDRNNDTTPGDAGFGGSGGFRIQAIEGLGQSPMSRAADTLDRIETLMNDGNVIAAAIRDQDAGIAVT